MPLVILSEIRRTRNKKRALAKPVSVVFPVANKKEINYTESRHKVRKHVQCVARLVAAQL